MTGFVFTFSLLCTAALQADPAILQRPETGVLRPLLEAALPAVHLNTTRNHGELRVPVTGTLGSGIPACNVAAPRGTAITMEYRIAQLPLRRLRPIRAPTVS
ncbi:MAG: hypothetical protein RRA94_03045 [Bacteroidota bacterium]|nr:hypothetical protein [Bacteroidota bacterium]